ncbi:MAG: hypothetical protein ACOCTG_02205, partial [Bacteroidota bacterium]
WVGFNTPSVTFRRSAWGQGSRTALPIVGEYFVRTSDQNVFSGQGWSPPPGYSPPQERDSLYFLAEDERFDSMIDSLRAVTDSLLAEGADLEGNPLDPDTIEFGDDIFAEEDDGQREGRDADDAEVGPEEPPLEELSETDRLNRLERTGGSIDDEGGEQEETEEEDRAGW